jgi:CubicO group peptidase (beta-lactamase class C family)
MQKVERTIPVQRLALLLVVACWLICIPVVAGEPGLPGLERIAPAMQESVDRHEISGAVTVVGRRSGIVSYEAVGRRDLERGLPMTRDTLFRIASMTKPITGLAVMLLVDEGRLSIDDEVEKHLPEFRGQMLVAAHDRDTITLRRPPRKITIRDLLTHTSGLPSRMPEGLADLYLKRNHTLAEGVMAFSQRPLDFPPGSKWAYCNAGIDTLGRIVEVVSRMPYEEFLKKRIFEPLGMRDTTFYPTEQQLSRMAQLYEVKPGKLVPAGERVIGTVRPARYPIPAGGLCSTGADLARLYQMLLCGGRFDGRTILSPKSLAHMTTVQTGELTVGFVPGMGYGLACGVVRQPQGVTAMLSPGTFGHGGAFGTQGWIDPKQDVFLVLLIQRVGVPNGDASEVRRRFQELAVAAIRGR